MRRTKRQPTNLVPLLGVKNCSDHSPKTEFWFLLGVLFKISDDHSRHFCMGVAPLPPIPGAEAARGITPLSDCDITLVKGYFSD